MSKEIVISVHQPNYIPWKGFFDMIHQSDVFVIYDTVQYTKNDWRNRNRIKTSQGPKWLTIPVRRLSLSQKISEAKTLNQRWAIKHWKSISQAYARTPYFHLYAERLEGLYANIDTDDLCEINLRFLRFCCEALGIHTPIKFSRDYELKGDRIERLLTICQQEGASTYLTGPRAKNYLQVAPFEDAGIEVKWMDYSQYPAYPQLHGNFVHEVSVLDLLFHTGPRALKYILAVESLPKAL